MSVEFSIIVPAFNEADSIVDTLSELQTLDGDYEIIVVDDGSTDDTATLAREFEVTLVKHEVNKGYGASLKTGVKLARNNIIVITDADRTYPNERIPELVDEFVDNKLSMVVGARIGDNVNIPLIRKPAKWILNKLANYLTGVEIPDLNSGLRVMDKSIIMRFIHIICDGFSFTTTITLCMLTNQYDVKYIPINYHVRHGTSKIRPIRDTLNFFQLIIRTSMYFDPLKIFVPASILLFVFAFVVLGYSYFFLNKVMDVTFGVVLMTSVTMMGIGMLADLIDKRLK